MKLDRPACALAAVLLFGACKPEGKDAPAKTGAAASPPAASSPIGPAQQGPAQAVAKSILPAAPASGAVAADEKAKQDAGRVFDNTPAADELSKLAGDDKPAVAAPAPSPDDKARADASLTAAAVPAVALDDPSRAPAAPEVAEAGPGFWAGVKDRAGAVVDGAKELAAGAAQAVKEYVVEPTVALAEKVGDKAGELYASAKEQVVETYARASQAVKEHVVEPAKALAEKVGGKAGELYASAKRQVVETAARVKEKAQELVASATTKVTEVAAQVKTAAQEFAAPVTAKVAEVAAKVKETSAQVKAAVGDKIGQATQAARGLFDGALKCWGAFGR
ncbi:MAG: hypothetical protein NTY77_16675 [Elusimicrobia bacterium]|nr:hypothetical protein [Elusimicrobiota bacterium]